jgi:myo-inositol-1(or 4)-monophosphatase
MKDEINTIAVAAGKKLLAMTDIEIGTKALGEIVTSADKELNNYIIDQITKQFPDDDIISEEEAPIENKGANVWYIDPIDGTTNFISGIPQYCVSIGYEKDGNMVAGTVYDPVHDALMYANEDGAFHGEKRMNVSSIDRVKDAFVFEGASREQENRKTHHEILHVMSGELHRWRNIGSAALMMAYVARGSADAALFTGAKTWDIAAGVALIRTSGGKVTNYKGKEWKPAHQTMLASNGKIHDELLSYIQGAL